MTLPTPTPARPEQAFELRGDTIRLGDLLKAAALVGSGGMAKLWIQQGQVEVDGEVETRRGRQLRRGQVVRAAGVSLRLV